MPKPFPPKTGDASLFIRSDFTNDSAWIKVRDAADADVYVDPGIPFHARLIVIDDRDYEGISPSDVAELGLSDPGHRVVFVVDSQTLSDPDYPILAVDTSEIAGATIRVTPSKVWMIENNVNEVNVSFAEYAERVGKISDGILR